MKSVVGIIQNLQKFGSSQRGPPKKFSRLAIARHGGPAINLFVIPTLLTTVQEYIIWRHIATMVHQMKCQQFV